MSDEQTKPLDLAGHVDAILAILKGRADAEAEQCRAWLASLPVGAPLTSEEQEAASRAAVSRKAGDFLPGEEMSLRIALQGLRTRLVPTLGTLYAEDVAFVADAIERAAAYIHDRRLFVAPRPPASIDPVAVDAEAARLRLHSWRDPDLAPPWETTLEATREEWRRVARDVLSRLDAADQDRDALEEALRIRTEETDAELRRLAATIKDLLASVSPHPVEHPTMHVAWARARAVLASPFVTGVHGIAFADIAAERAHQVQKGRTAARDDARTREEWVACVHLVLRNVEVSARQVWVKLGSVAVAAIEAHDRATR